METDYIKYREIKPSLSGYLRESQAQLNKSVMPDEKVIHDIRVLMKKSRAVLKLIAPQIDKVSINRDIIDLRDVGRILSVWRETAVHRKTLKELKKEFPGIFSKLTDNEKLGSLMQKPEPIQELSEEMKAGLELIKDLLKKAQFRIRFQSMNMLDPSLLLNELESTYAKVSDIYITCRNSPGKNNVHEFRKKSKDFLYQIFFFRSINPSTITILEKRLDTMTRNLGKFNDLTQLVKTLGYRYRESINLPAMDELIIKIREKQDKYLSAVWPTAYKIFCPGQKLINILGSKLLII